MIRSYQLGAAILLSAALGISITLHIALRRFQCTSPDGAEQTFFGMLSPYRTEFSVTGTESPILWLTPFLINALVVAGLCYMVAGRSIARGRSATSPAANLIVPLAFTAVIAYFTALGFEPYAVIASGFPVADESACAQAFEYAPGAAATSFDP